MSRTDQAKTERWQKHVESYQASGLTREGYCRKHDLKVYQLDYWRRKQNGIHETAKENNGAGFVQLQVKDEAPSNSSIALRIGNVTVEVKSAFDPKHLESILRVLGATC
jgi:hypothetical protein